MAASLSRPDPSSPASVAEAAFSTARRGYQPDEVRAFLVAVAAELGRLRERERQLEAELERARELPQRDELDDETVTTLLGEETLRVLQTARESASQIKIRAEDTAARVLREANDEANRLRQEVDVEVARRRQDAASDAEAEVALAKQQGREMVNEARAYRERVLADLERRTTLARHQIEELIHGRDRLLQVFERARLVAVDVTSELKAIDAPDELVNLTPTTGPVPIMVPAGRSGRTGADEAPEDEVADDVADAEPADGEPAADGATEDAVAEEEASPDEVADDAVLDEEVADDAVLDEEVADDAVVHDEVADEEMADDPAPPPSADTNVVSLFRGRTSAADAAAADEHPSTESPDAETVPDADVKPDVEAIFERLRQDAEPEPPPDAEPTASEPEPDAEPTAFSRRDEAIVPLIVSGARRLKRVLADEQNEALDTLRRREPVTALDDLVPPLDEHTALYVGALADELGTAAVAGAAELGARDTKTLRRKLVKAGALADAEEQVRSALVVPLRDRLERAVGDGDGDNDDITRRVRAVYREWKTQHIDDQLDDAFRRAFSGGLAVSIEPRTPLVWTVDPNHAACPDCEDNSLAGAVAAGDEFPTGHPAAPAHPGCTCLALPGV